MVISRKKTIPHAYLAITRGKAAAHLHPPCIINHLRTIRPSAGNHAWSRGRQRNPIGACRIGCRSWDFDRCRRGVSYQHHQRTFRHGCKCVDRHRSYIPILGRTQSKRMRLGKRRIALLQCPWLRQRVRLRRLL